MEIKIDKEFKNLIPPLEKEERKQLENSLKSEGMRDAITIWNGIIVDGHNRYDICQENNIPIKTTKKKFNDRNEVVLWMIDNQLGRRNISKYDRGRLSIMKVEILRPKAIENMKSGTTLSSKDEKVNTVKAAATLAKVGDKTISKIKFIEEKADANQKKDLSSQKVSINKTYNELKKAEKRKQIAEDFKQPIFPKKNKKYNIIYADPPWSFKHYSDKGKGRAPDNHYKCQNLEDIKNLPIDDIAADDCVLFMWVTYPFLQKSFDVLKAWGFTYKTVGFTWIKKNKKADSLFWGMGYWTRSNAEICIIATRGSIPRQSSSVHQIIETPIEAHSKKPDVTRDRIVELVGDIPRIELFARQAPKGWDVWGNEV